MDEIAEKVQAEYDEMYNKCIEESICLNKNNWNACNHFSFLVRGVHLLMLTNSAYCREFDHNTYKKTNDCKIIIDSIYILIVFKLFVKTLKSEIKNWDSKHQNIELTINDIKEKAIIDVLKKEISFMKNRLKFEKLWFTRLSRY